MIAVSGLNLAVGPAMGIGIALRATDQGWGAEAVGIFEALVGVGAAIGAAGIATWRPRREASAGFRALASVTALWVPCALCGAGLAGLMVFPLRNRMLRTVSLRPAKTSADAVI